MLYTRSCLHLFKETLFSLTLYFEITLILGFAILRELKLSVLKSTLN